MSESGDRPLGADEHVILVDARGRPSGTAPKATVHGPPTPLHLASALADYAAHRTS